MEKTWKFIGGNIDKNALRELSAQLGLSPAICTALMNRGITAENAGEYINGRRLHSPFRMKDIDKAAERVERALKDGEKICVYGDYDVDGIASTAMLTAYLAERGAHGIQYIPTRDDGYGVNIDAVRKIAEKGVKLIITVDTGISAVEEAEEAARLGVDMVITDHHECGPVLPRACAVVDPKRSDCDYPFKPLAGVGVAFKLICALDGNEEKCLRDWGAYLALATLADVVPLVDENRVMTVSGIGKMRGEPVSWADALMDNSGVNKSTLSSYQLAFMLAPRVNAAGRMNNAYLSLKLLNEKDYNSALPLAQQLEKENSTRKALGDEVMAAAEKTIGTETDKKVIVAAGEGWHPGVIGIVASRLLEKYHRNVILISLKDGIGRGSARALPGLNLYEALSYSGKVLEKFGGHEKAAGLTLKEENIPELERLVNEYADREMPEDSLIPELYIDCALSCETSLLQLCEEQKLMEPFGEGNTKPVFAVLGAYINAVRKSRDEKHIMIRIIKRGQMFSCVGFGLGYMADVFCEGDVVDIAANIDINVYQEQVTPQFHIIDIKKSQRKPTLYTKR